MHMPTHANCLPRVCTHSFLGTCTHICSCTCKCTHTKNRFSTTDLLGVFIIGRWYLLSSASSSNEMILLGLHFINVECHPYICLYDVDYLPATTLWIMVGDVLFAIEFGDLGQGYSPNTHRNAICQIVLHSCLSESKYSFF